MIIPPLVGIDLDHVISTDGELSPVAQEILAAVDTYTETSPSGTGIHLL
jgi:primase-polymerase (primpol)-like protein